MSKRTSRILPDHHVYPHLPDNVPRSPEVAPTVKDARESVDNKEITKFFKMCYNIDPPFKVLQDASFFTYMERNNITKCHFAELFCDVDHKLYITSHTIETLKNHAKKGELGISDCIQEAEKCSVQRCGNKQNCLTESECIEVLVGNDNPMGFVVASWDKDLKRNLKKMSSVPLVRGREDSLELRLPPQLQIDHALERRNNGPRQEKSKKRNRASAERKLKQKRQKAEQDATDFTESLYAAALAREIKNSPKWKQVPVCIMSADSEAEQVERCYEEGAVDYLAKPVKADQAERLKQPIVAHKISKSN